MKSAYRKRIVWPIVVLVLLLILGSLMYLQYQWAKQVSDAAKAHVAADLRKSILAWHLDLFRTFSSAAVALRLNSEPEEYPNHRSYADRYLEWRAMSAHTAIVSNVYVWSIDDDRNAQMLRWDEASGDFEPAPWPAKFESLRKRLQRKSSALALAVAGASSPEEFFADHPQKDMPFQVGGAPDDVLGGWVFDPEIPALFHPIAHEATGVNLRKPAGPLKADWIVIEYNQDALRNEILPELTQRYFSGAQGLEYDLSLVAGKGQSSPIYRSDQQSGTITEPDARLDVFGPARLPDLASAIGLSQGEENEISDDYSTKLKSYHLRGAFWFPVVHTDSHGEDWYLLVRHRGGSLSEMFIRMRRRDLVIGMGVVVLLGLSMGLVLLAGHRARVMARLQVEFVAGVSHDLRTPLSIISLAADNLADGVVSNREAVIGYGARLQVQVRRLTERVEQILLFSSLNRHRTPYSIGMVDVKSVIETAVRTSSVVTDDAGIDVEVTVEPDLPPALTDPAVLSQALENLITNAVKYGGEDRWLGIRAKAVPAGRQGTEIQVLVEDHGIGIERGELDRIFEPFYRSAAVVFRQISGTGLGLTLTKRTVEAVGGSVSVTSIPGKGSTFVLHLPAGQVKTSEVRVETYAAS